MHLSASNGAVSNGYPPYELYEFPPAIGKIPPHRTDSGAFLLSDAYGAATTTTSRTSTACSRATPLTMAATTAS